MDRLLDQARTGPSYLRRPEIAQVVVDSLLFCGEKMYDLHSYVVMPNHVHLLITPQIEVSKITQSLKRSTARTANRVLGLTGPFWQDESYDRLMRDQPEFDRIRHYIEWNPVKAGLASSPDQYPWSSVGQACSLRADL
jgi:REP element-mobilizing transposase RayT